LQIQLRDRQRRGIEAACLDIWKPYGLTIEQCASNCRIIDKFHVIQDGNPALDEVWRAEFFRKGGRWRGLVKVCWFSLKWREGDLR